MAITCFIRYEIDPFQLDAFRDEERTFLANVEGTIGIPPVSCPCA